MSKITIHQVGGHNVTVRGSVLRIGQLKQEFYYEVDDPKSFIELLKGSAIKMDVFTFLDKFPQEKPQYDYYMEWDNFAVIPVTTFEQWHQKAIPKATRRGLRKAQEFGVEVRWAELDDTLVRQIGEIFNETPVRQGRPYWHYGKDFAAVKEVLMRDIERSRFLGAYCGGELVGFTKLIYGRNFVRTTLIMSKIAHRSKYPNNAMVAKVVEICVEQKIPYVVYGQMEHGNVGNKTLADFKTNNGFEKATLPRYFVPLNWKGRLILKCGLQHGFIALIPKSLIQLLLRLRARWYALRTPSPKAGTPALAGASGEE